MSGDDSAGGGAVKGGAGILGVGAAVCVACCAGPILGALGAIGVATAVGYAIAGAMALGVGAAAVAWVLDRRRRRQRACASERVTFVASPPLIPSAEPADRRADGRAGAVGALPRPAREPTPG